MRWPFNMGTRPSKNGYKAIADTNVIFFSKSQTVEYHAERTIFRENNCHSTSGRILCHETRTDQPITSEDQIACRNSPFQRKRIKMKALLRLKNLERKERRQVAKKGEKDSSSRT